MESQIAHIASLLEQPNPDPAKALMMLNPLAQQENAPWPVFHYLGMAYIHKKDFKTALRWLQKSMSAGSDTAMTYHLMSMCHYSLAAFEEAEKFEKKALEDKSFYKGWMHLGTVYRVQAKLKEALKCYKQALELEPENKEIAVKMAEIYRDQGRLDKAIELFEFTIKEGKENFSVYNDLAKILIQKGRYEDAEQYVDKMIAEKPESDTGQMILANLCRHKGDYSKSIEVSEQLLDKDPHNTVRLNYGLCLQELGRFEQAEEEYMKVLSEHPNLYQPLSNYLMCIHYNPKQSKEDIFEAHKLWDQHFAPAERPKRPVPTLKDRHKKLRIGLISGGLKMHPVGWMITKGLEHLQSDQFEIYCYTTNNSYDFITNRISATADKWQSVIGYTEEVVANMIREDEIDILIELSGHAAHNRLRAIALEPAPIIAKWVGGLFNTTGLRSVDYLITDFYESPEGEEKYYTEKLVRMPDDYICYLPPQYAPEVGALPAKENGYVTFGCFNNPSKINSEILEQWSKVLKRLPDSRLMLKSKQYDTKALCNQVLAKLEGAGISRDRIIFKGHSSHKDHLSYYNQVDIALDPWPYSGGVTTCEALWMGVPVISKPGPTFAGRHSATHLTNAGFAEWVVDSWDGYVETTVALAENQERLTELRQSMREKVENSPLCNGLRFGAHLSVALRKMWSQWVDGYENNIEHWQGHIDVEALSEQEINDCAALIKVEEAKNKTEHKESDKSVEADVVEQQQVTTDQEMKDRNSSMNSISTDQDLKNSVTPQNEENDNQPEMFKIETTDGVTVCTPSDLDMLTPYVLLEQEEWFEPELAFVRAFLTPGMNIVDAGAGFGTYALPMAKLTHGEGKVYAFEPGAVARGHLERSKVENQLQNLEITGRALSDQTGEAKWQIAETPELNKIHEAGTEHVSLTTLDAWWEFENHPNIDFVKIDVNGSEYNALKGAEELLEEGRPVLLIAIGETDREGINQLEQFLQHKRYSLYEYIPGPGLLAEFDIQTEIDPYLMNLMAVHEGRREELTEDGWIYNESVETGEPEQGLWKKVLESYPWTESILTQWQEKDSQNESYLRALDYLCASEQIDPQNIEKDASLRSVKGTLLIQGVQQLIQLYNSGSTQPPVALSLARGLYAIGNRAQAVEVLNSVMERQQALQADLPFLLPLPEQDNRSIKTDFNKWLTVRLVEGWLRMKSVSTYFSGEQQLELLDMLKGNPEAGSHIQRIIGLRNKELGPNGKENDSIGFFRSETIDLIDVAKEDYSYSNPEGVAIIMPCIDKKRGLETAKTLVQRAGMPCKVVIAYDSVGAGFIQTLNRVAKSLNVKYVVYLAQDAFPGRYWLKMAFTQMEKSGKGLLAFNDAKWNGRIASFGMVRVKWAQTLYEDAILYPGYNSHCADDEITAIARATNQHVYNPNIVLVEVDHTKGMVGGGNFEDRRLLHQRFKQGFDGSATIENLEVLANEYNVQNAAVNGSFRNKEARVGDRPKHEILAEIHNKFNPQMYFEIGVQTGKSLVLSNCQAIGVDPMPQIRFSLPDYVEVLKMTSDDFFKKGAEKWINNDADLTFIDGMHLVEYALRDFINTEKISSPTSIIVIDDIFPGHPVQAQRDRKTSTWAGDIWKLFMILKQYRPDLFLLPVNASPTGLLLVAGLDPSSNVLEAGYNEIITRFTKDMEPPREILDRKGAIKSNDKLIDDFLVTMKSALLFQEPRIKVVKRLKKIF